MELKDCTFGILVKNKKTGEVGMVKGVTNSISSVLSEEQKDPSRAIPLIEWQSGQTYGINSNNIEKLK